MSKSKPLAPEKPKFPGILNQPIPEPNALAMATGYGSSEEVRAALADSINSYFFQQRMKRIYALAEHYGVSLIGSPIELVLFELLLKLAEDFDIPGFKIGHRGRRGPGRPRGTGKGDPFELWKSVDRLVHDRNLSVSAACLVLSKKGRWKDESPRALCERYRRFLAKSKQPYHVPPELEDLYNRLVWIAAKERHEN
jgi:hypothetical protein